jgi:hypothetical protein
MLYLNRLSNDPITIPLWPVVKLLSSPSGAPRKSPAFVFDDDLLFHQFFSAAQIHAF